jgi:four helix bundle protein
MGSVKRFEDLDVWKKARAFCNDIFHLTQQGPFSKDYSLKDQINRSSGSIMDNIAEDFERDGRSEFIQFLSYSKSSAAEAKSQLYRALDRNYIGEKDFANLYDQSGQIGKMLGGFINYLKKSDIRGLKFKVNEPLEEYINYSSKESEV